MGKRIIQQARGKGSLTYRVRKKAFKYKASYPKKLSEEMKIIKLFSSAGHSAPLIKIMDNKGNIFYNLAAQNVYEGQVLKNQGKSFGDVAQLKDIDAGTKIFNIENYFGDGGKLVKSGGNSAVILGKQEGIVRVLMPSKKEKKFNEKCRATVGELAGQGRLDKPVLKAGKKYYIKKAKSKLWPRTSAVKMNAIDHPFGSGRGKRIKSKIVKRFSSPGQKVGLLKPRRTGRKNR